MYIASALPDTPAPQLEQPDPRFSGLCTFTLQAALCDALCQAALLEAMMLYKRKITAVWDLTYAPADGICIICRNVKSQDIR